MNFPEGANIKIDSTLDDLTTGQLQQIMRYCDVTVWQPLLVSTMGRFGIVTPVRVAAFLAQTAYESREFRRLEENMNYSAKRIMEVWPRRFPTLQEAAAYAWEPEKEAAPYAYEPEKLANRVYANRLGNGDEASGDGWRYRGGGPMQLTGKSNFRAAQIKTGHNFLTNPELLRVPGQPAADSAGWFWYTQGCNKLADDCLKEDLEASWKKLTRRIRGSSVSWQRRLSYFTKGMEVLS